MRDGSTDVYDFVTKACQDLQSNWCSFVMNVFISVYRAEVRFRNEISDNFKGQIHSSSVQS